MPRFKVPVKLSECFYLPLIIVAAGAAGYVFFLSSSGLLERQALLQKKDRLTMLAGKLKAENDSLKERYNEAQNEETALKIAGQKYLMLSDSSRILRFQEPNSSKVVHQKVSETQKKEEDAFREHIGTVRLSYWLILLGLTFGLAGFNIHRFKMVQQ